MIQHLFLNIARKFERSNGGMVDVFRLPSGGISVQETITPSGFLKDYVLTSTPVTLKGYCKEWKAFRLWQNDKYIRQKSGKNLVNVEVSKSLLFTGDDDATEKSTKKMKVSKFLDEYLNPSREHNYYLAETDIKHLGAIEDDIPRSTDIFKVISARCMLKKCREDLLFMM
jgi:hypothetical protein